MVGHEKMDFQFSVVVIKNHQFGTGFIVEKRLKHLIINFKPTIIINEQISRLWIRGKFLIVGSLIHMHQQGKKSIVE